MEDVTIKDTWGDSIMVGSGWSDTGPRCYLTITEFKLNKEHVACVSLSRNQALDVIKLISEALTSEEPHDPH